MTGRSKLRNPLLAVALAAVLAASAVACSSDDDAATTTTTAAETTTTAEATTTTEADDTTTTTEANGGAECSPEALALAGSAGNYDTVDNYGCDDGYAWVWLSDSSGTATGQISEILEDDGGSWSPLSLDAICGAASAGYPPEIVQNGCAFFDDDSDTGDDTDADDTNDGDTTD